MAGNLKRKSNDEGCWKLRKRKISGGIFSRWLSSIPTPSHSAARSVTGQKSNSFRVATCQSNTNGDTSSDESSEEAAETMLQESIFKESKGVHEREQFASVWDDILSHRKGFSNVDEYESRDPVSVVNEYGQQNRLKVEFQQLKHTGPDHRRVFFCELYIGDEEFGTGEGNTKKAAKKDVALKALGILGATPDKEASPSSKNSIPCSSVDGVKHPVSLLNEYCQAHGLGDAQVIDLSPIVQTMDHLPKFVIAYQIHETQYPAARGKNKKMAQRRAAMLTLNEIKAGQVPKVVKIKTDSLFDRLAELSWTRYYELERLVPEDWKMVNSYKIVAAIIVKMSEKDEGQVVSLGTGNRCITGENLVMDGSRINDSHAEVIARRGFLRYLYHQVQILRGNGDDVKCIFEKRTTKTKMKVKKGVEFYLYISTAPCGDARVFCNNQTRLSPEDDCNTRMHNPSYTARGQGALRTKIERGEGTIPIGASTSRLTLDGVYGSQRLRTASCSDKILRWNVLGLQGALLTRIIQPIYLTAMAVGTYYDTGHLYRAICCRAEKVGEDVLSGDLPEAYHVNHPEVGQGLLEDRGSAREIETKSKTADLSLNWSAVDGDCVEMTVGSTGCVCGSEKPSRISKCKLFDNFKVMMGNSKVFKNVLSRSYIEAKHSARGYLNAKNEFIIHLEVMGYGSWEFMKKPDELQDFGETTEERKTNLRDDRGKKA